MFSPLDKAPQEKSVLTLPQVKKNLNTSQEAKHSLLSTIKPKTSHKPLEGLRTIRFLGFKYGRSPRGKNTLSLLFRDTETEQQIARTVNLDPQISDKGYFKKYTIKLVGDPTKFAQAAKEGSLEALINDQRGRDYEAPCSPSDNGQYTNIDDFWALGSKRN
jgi:hypothetical protein